MFFVRRKLYHKIPYLQSAKIFDIICVSGAKALAMRMMKDQSNKPSTLNARQVYDTFGIARGKLSALVRAGLVRVVALGPVDEDDEELKIYSFEDLWNLTHPEGAENV